MSNNKVAVTLIRSPIGRKPSHKATVIGLGLRKIRQTVVLEDTPSVRGMIHNIAYMLSVTEV